MLAKAAAVTGTLISKIREARYIHVAPEATHCPTDFGINRLTLNFRNRDVEALYRDFNFRENISFSRRTTVLGALTMLAFSILDYFVIPDIFEYALFLRFAVCMPLLLLIVAATFLPFSYATRIRIFSLVLLVPNIVILAMIAQAETLGSGLYYAGVLVTIAFCASLWRFGFLYSVFMAMLTAALYAGVVALFNPLDQTILINNIFFLIWSITINCYHTYTFELKQRTNFVRQSRLEYEQARAEDLFDKSQAANRAKDEFLATMSHELRTPLNAIIGFSDIITNEMMGPIGQARYVEYSKDINSSGHHLLNIINEILDFSKSDVKDLVVGNEEFSPAETLEKTERMLSVKASERQISLSVAHQDAGVTLHGDERLFTQAMINLVSNAIKFTPDNGKVSVRTRMLADGSFEITVTDTGIGLKKEDLERVFEPFVQVEGAMSRKFEGTGLGLPMVRKIAEAHHGSVHLESDGESGTIAVFRVPATRVTAMAA